jgi:hypothetical protein
MFRQMENKIKLRVCLENASKKAACITQNARTTLRISI